MAMSPACIAAGCSSPDMFVPVKKAWILANVGEILGAKAKVYSSPNPTKLQAAAPLAPRPPPSSDAYGTEQLLYSFTRMMLT